MGQWGFCVQVPVWGCDLVHFSTQRACVQLGLAMGTCLCPEGWQETGEGAGWRLRPLGLQEREGLWGL